MIELDFYLLTPLVADFACFIFCNLAFKPDEKVDLPHGLWTDDG